MKRSLSSPDLRNWRINEVNEVFRVAIIRYMNPFLAMEVFKYVPRIANMLADDSTPDGYDLWKYYFETHFLNVLVKNKKFGFEKSYRKSFMWLWMYFRKVTNVFVQNNYKPRTVTEGLHFGALLHCKWKRIESSMYCSTPCMIELFLDDKKCDDIKNLFYPVQIVDVYLKEGLNVRKSIHELDLTLFNICFHVGIEMLLELGGFRNVLLAKPHDNITDREFVIKYLQFTNGLEKSLLVGNMEERFNIITSTYPKHPDGVTSGIYLG